MARVILFAALALIISALSPPAGIAADETVSIAPVRGMITLIDIGGDSCTPCKMMIPILRQLEEKYSGKAAFISINVGKNRNLDKFHNVRVIPTQIFFDREGKEVSRHEGFMDMKSIEDRLEKMGAGRSGG